MNRQANSRLLAAAAIVVAAFLAGASAKTITVDDDGLADFNNIQAAIDASADGDVVLVAPGTYTGDGNRDIDFRGKAITVKSEVGPKTCIIDCQGSKNEFHRGFYFHSGEDAKSVLDGFTVTGAYAEWGGGGILCDESSPSICNCAIVGNTATAGGGILTARSDAVISNCVIAGNINYVCVGSNSDGGGGVYCSHNHPVFWNCTIYGNRATRFGGGILCGGGWPGEALLQNCIFVGNRAGLGGNEIYAPGSTCTTRGGCITAEILACCVEDEPNAVIWDQAWDNPLEPPAGSYIMVDPKFATSGYWDPNGTPDDSNDDFWVGGDYHLKSQAGRWDPQSQSWIQDDATSPCIDAGDPASPVGQEAFPNGGVINMGAYGGAAEASKSYFGKPVCETIIVGDINGDCKVDAADLSIMAYHWLCEQQ